MRLRNLPAAILTALALLSMVSHAAPEQKFRIVNDTTPDDAEVTVEDADGPYTISCAGTLEVRCPSQSSYVAVESAETIGCSSDDSLIHYRSVSSAGAWHGTVDVACGLTAASAPEEANASLQIVNVTGTLSSCAPYALTASSRCQFFCKGPSGSVPC